MVPKIIQRWHDFVATKDGAILDELIADEAVFYSPVVFKPQQGKTLMKMYLQAASVALISDSFRYLKQVYNDGFAVLEFETEIDGIIVNGVDMICWNQDNQITEFKVMIRPLRGINAVHQAMGDRLIKMS